MLMGNIMRSQRPIVPLRYWLSAVYKVGNYLLLILIRIGMLILLLYSEYRLPSGED